MAREAAANDALARLFVQENMRREMQQNQFGENATNRNWRGAQQDKALSWQEARQDRSQAFTAQENEANRRNAMDMTQYRTDAATARAGNKAGKYQVVYGNDVLQAWNAIEQKYKIPQGYLATIIGPESGGGANQVSATSSARGPFQFITGTANEMGLGDRFDPIKAGEAAAKLAAQNRDYATKMSNGAIRWTGGPQDIRPLYMLHQQGGPNGWKLLLPANMTRQAVSVGHPANLMANGVTPSMTVQDMHNMWDRKLIPWFQSYGARMTQIGGGNPPAPGAPQYAGQPQPQQPQQQQQPQPQQQQQPEGWVPAPQFRGQPPVQVQSTPATNPSQPATTQQPQQQQTQPQPGRGSVPPSTISPQVFAQPPNAVAGASGAGAPLPTQVGAPATAAPAPVNPYASWGDGADTSQLGGAVNVPSSQTTVVTGAPAGALGDRATPSTAAPPPPGTRKKVTKYIDDDGVLRFSAPQ
jgi:Vesicle coat complex COPII, subunit SEC24/subunit SFB2/subunit SFB3